MIAVDTLAPAGTWWQVLLALALVAAPAVGHAAGTSSAERGAAQSNYKQIAKALAAADVWIMPQPKTATLTGGSFDLKKCKGIRLLGAASKPGFKADLPALLKVFSGVSLEAVPGRIGPGLIVLGLFPDGKPSAGFPGVPTRALAGLGEQGYVLHIGKSGVAAAATGKAGLFYAIRTIAQIAADRTKLPCLDVRDWPSLKYRGAQPDISRGQMPTMATLKRLARLMSLAKMNTMELYIENVFKWKKHPDIAPPEAITPEEARDLFDYCAQYHVEVHPFLEVLGHSGLILNKPQYQHLRVRDNVPWVTTFDIRKPEAVAFAQDLVGEICDAFPGEFLNVDITETDLAGFTESGTTEEQFNDIVFQYTMKLRETVRSHGMRLMVSQCSLFCPGTNLSGLGPKLDKLPRDVAISSYYETFYVKAWEKDFPLLQEAGIDYFSNGWIESHVRIMPNTTRAAELSDAQVSAGVKYGAAGSVTSDWGDDGHVHFTGLEWYPFLYHGACAWTGANIDRDYFNQAYSRLIFGVKDDTIPRAINLVGGINGQKIKVRKETGEVVEEDSYHLFEAGGDVITSTWLTRLADPVRMGKDMIAPADQALPLLQTGYKIAKRNRDNIEQLIWATEYYQAIARRLIARGRYLDESVPRKEVGKEFAELATSSTLPK